MVGPWQVPVADVAVTTASFDTHAGEAMAMGERPPVALIDPAASARLAVAEAITNLAAAPIAKLSDIKLSANWMSAADHVARTRRCMTPYTPWVWRSASAWHRHSGGQGLHVHAHRLAGAE
jgi:phosphoribosylformylglycinamidine (FGAM) synthase-like enzyme